MSTPNYVPVAFGPNLYLTKMNISNNATAPNTQIDVSSGLGRDSTNTFDINLGNFQGAIQGQPTDVITTLDATRVGANGIDTGALVASNVYAIYAIGAPLSSDASAVILSLKTPDVGPIMPFNYGVYRLIGYAVTDSSAHFLPGYWSGNSTERRFMYDAPQVTSITAGNATTYTNINLITLVPNVDKLPVWITSSFTPGAAGRALNLTPAGATGNAATSLGQVTSVVVPGDFLITSRQATISSVVSPSVAYKVANAGDAAAINVAGFECSL